IRDDLVTGVQTCALPILRNTLREVIRENGLSPEKLMQDWETIERGIHTWLRSGHLNNIVVEFFKPGASVASARWEFPIGYAGSRSEERRVGKGGHRRRAA